MNAFVIVVACFHSEQVKHPICCRQKSQSAVVCELHSSLSLFEIIYKMLQDSYIYMEHKVSCLFKERSCFSENSPPSLGSLLDIWFVLSGYKTPEHATLLLNQ